MQNLPHIQNWINSSTEENEEINETEDLFVYQENETSKNICLFYLPDEIILQIFSHLDTYSRIKVKLVCQKLKVLVEDPMLWKSLSFEGKDDMSHIPKVLEKCYLLEHLLIDKGKIDPSILGAIPLSSHDSHLQSISLHFCDILPDCELPFEKLMKSLRNLNFLDLEGCNVSKQILSAINEAKGLQHINLSHCFHLGNKSLVRILESCKKLRELNLDGINFLHQNSINSILRIRSDTLISLIIDGENLSDDAFTYIEQCSLLTKLSISFCDSITDYTLRRLKQMSHLKFLKLRKGFALTPVGLQNMFKCGSMSQLTHLNLSECSLLNDPCLTTIAEKCPELTSLYLSWCWELTDNSVYTVVQKCPKMVVMNLTGLVCLEGSFLMGLKLGFLKELEVMNLEQCGLVHKGQLDEIVELRPTLKIFGYWGDIIKSEQ